MSVRNRCTDVTMAKDAVTSTIRKILVYTAEIIASIILLIVICIPLAFAVPGWLQHVVLGVPKSNIWVNPVALFGYDITVLITVGMAVLSLILGYPLTMKLVTAEPEETEKKKKKKESQPVEPEPEPEQAPDAGDDIAEIEAVTVESEESGSDEANDSAGAED